MHCPARSGACARPAMPDACCGTAAHLTDHVVPEVPLRQWVLSVPFELRLLLARDPFALTAVGRIFVQEIFRSQRERARRSRLRSTASGAVCFPQRFGGSMNLNVHFHVAVPDGVFTSGPGHVRGLGLPRVKTRCEMSARRTSRGCVHVQGRIVSRVSVKSPVFYAERACRRSKVRHHRGLSGRPTLRRWHSEHGLLEWRWRKRLSRRNPALELRRRRELEVVRERRLDVHLQTFVTAN